MPDLERLRRIAEAEFLDIISAATVFRNRLRIVLLDDSYIDFWWSRRIRGRFAYHWERRYVDGTIYRHDNAPHALWQSVDSFPKHFHSGSQQTVTVSDIPDDPEQGLRHFLEFARDLMA